MFAGIVLIIVGIIFLLRNLGILTGDVWGTFWPLIVIALGLSLLTKRGRTQWKHIDKDKESD